MNGEFEFERTIVKLMKILVLLGVRSEDGKERRCN